MNEITTIYLNNLRSSSQYKNVLVMANSLLGRNDAIPRLADYLQDLCPCILNRNTNAEKCAQYESTCGMEFNIIAEQIIHTLDPIRLVK